MFGPALFYQKLLTCFHMNNLFSDTQSTHAVCFGFPLDNVRGVAVLHRVLSGPKL